MLIFCSAKKIPCLTNDSYQKFPMYSLRLPSQSNKTTTVWDNQKPDIAHMLVGSECMMLQNDNTGSNTTWGLGFMMGHMTYSIKLSYWMLLPWPVVSNVDTSMCKTWGGISSPRLSSASCNSFLSIVPLLSLSNLSNILCNRFKYKTVPKQSVKLVHIWPSFQLANVPMPLAA